MEGSTSRAALKYQAFRLNWQIKRMKACQDDSAAILDTQKLEIKRAERARRLVEQQLQEAAASLPFAQPGSDSDSSEDRGRMAGELETETIVLAHRPTFAVRVRCVPESRYGAAGSVITVPGLSGHSSISTLVNHLATATGMLPEQMRMQFRGSEDYPDDDFATDLSHERSFATLAQIQTVDDQHPGYKVDTLESSPFPSTAAGRAAHHAQQRFILNYHTRANLDMLNYRSAGDMEDCDLILTCGLLGGAPARTRSQTRAEGHLKRSPELSLRDKIDALLNSNCRKLRQRDS
jgi:hypothetical protein